MTRLLLTGFGPFAAVTTNPSQVILESLAEELRGEGLELHAEALPVEYERAGAQIRALIEAARPDAVVMLGVAARREKVTPERFALNIDDASIPDNAGELRQGASIDPAGPPAYASTLPIARLEAALAAEGLPADISNDAGAFICNHVFYVARQTVDRLGLDIPCGFIHVPQASELAQPGQPDQPAGLPLADLLRGVRRCLRIVLEEIAA